MTRPREYLTALEDRLREDGCELSVSNLGGHQTLVAHRSVFQMRWLATRLHVYTVAIVQEQATLPALQAFADDAGTWARATKPGLPVGLQNGVTVFPVMVAERVDADAAAWAAEKQRVKFACMIRPVVVDSATGMTTWFQGQTKIGGVYSAYQVALGRQYFGSS